MTSLPRFLVCAGEQGAADDAELEFVAIDIPDRGERPQRAALMYSSSAKAREFIAHDLGAWHIRFFDMSALRIFLNDSRNKGQFDCIRTRLSKRRTTASRGVLRRFRVSRCACRLDQRRGIAESADVASLHVIYSARHCS